MCYEGILLGTPNREPQEYSRKIIEYKDPGRYIPIIILGFPVWGSQYSPFMLEMKHPRESEGEDAQCRMRTSNGEYMEKKPEP